MIAYFISPRIDNLYRKFGGVVFCAAIYVIFTAACYFFLDPDFGWHLKAGDYIRAHGVPAHDIFTYTARSFPWIDHEWLNDAFVSWLYGMAGYLGLSIFFGAVWASAVLLAGRRRNWLLLFVAATAVLPYSGIRPIAWTVILLVLLERLIAARDERWLLLTPPLFLLWANLHGGFLVGLAVLALEALRRRGVALAAALLCGVLVSFANPYGPNLYTELFRTLGDSSLHYRIQEWLPLTYSLSTLLFISYSIALFWLLERRRVRAVWSVPGALLATAISSSRNAPLYIVASVRLLEDYLKRLRDALPADVERGQRVVLVSLIVGPLLVAGYGVFSFFNPSGGLSYPREEVLYLRQHPCAGNLFNDYDFGGYLIWQLPGVPVYIDGRMPSWKFHGTDYFADFDRIYTDAAFRRQQFAQYDIRCALISRQPTHQKNSLGSLLGLKPKNVPSLQSALTREGWRIVDADNGSVLLEKN